MSTARRCPFARLRPEAGPFPSLAFGRWRSRPRADTTGRTVMEIRRRARREVYRVYSETEYFAGADAHSEWHTLLGRPAPPERRLYRLGAAGALTAALGALGGVIVFAGIGLRSPDRRVAATGALVKGRVPSRPAELDGAPPAGRDRSRDIPRARGARASAWRRVGGSAHLRRPVSAHVARLASRQRAAGSAPNVPAQSIGAMPAVAYDATRADPGKPVARSPTQSEFGFER